jgi:hypothetical protein
MLDTDMARAAVFSIEYPIAFSVWSIVVANDSLGWDLGTLASFWLLLARVQRKAGGLSWHFRVCSYVNENYDALYRR